MTSEGVFVFLDEALRDRGIDPKSGQTFTLKLTGVRQTDGCSRMLMQEVTPERGKGDSDKPKRYTESGRREGRAAGRRESKRDAFPWWPMLETDATPRGGRNSSTAHGQSCFWKRRTQTPNISSKTTPRPPLHRCMSTPTTQGPDGDVGGNMIKILNREYGDACLIVGVADGTGSAEDPEGLSHAELLRLFEEGLPISEYRFNKVSLLCREALDAIALS